MWPRRAERHDRTATRIAPMILETTTTMPPDDVLAQAKRFFARRNPIYAAFVEKEGSSFVSFRGQGGEELVIGVEPIEGGTSVRGSTYLFDQQISRFFATLPPFPVKPEVVIE
jgi:hypothetical protein